MISRGVALQGPSKWGEEENIVASDYIIKWGGEEYEDYLE